MALGYNTYYAIPRLDNYADAKRRHDNTKPMLRDPHNTRPCGRREQPWFSIWEDGTTGTIHVGYGRDPDHRRPLLTYHKSGVISIVRHSSFTSATDNDRIERLLGTTVKTSYCYQWIKCAWYDGGEKRTGFLPTRHNGARSWDGDGGPAECSNFVREPSGDLVFLNYQYPCTHKLDRKALKQVYAPYQGCLDYIENLRKLQGGTLSIAGDTLEELFGTVGVPNLCWGNDEVLANGRAELFTLMRSTDLKDWMRAMCIVADNSRRVTHTYPYRGPEGITLRTPLPLKWFDDYMLREHRDTVLVPTPRTDGGIVRSKYRKLFVS